MKKILSYILIFSMLLCFASCSPRKTDTELKYVFLFIGDGMSFNAVQLARDAAAARDGKNVPSELAFTDFDTVGIFTNYDNTSFIPDSASSGTAMATGKKTASGIIAETESGKELESIASVLKREYGMKTGIITTANINHATPAVFYAHSASRYNYYEIGTYLPKSGIDLFIGGRFLDPDGGGEDLVSMAEKGGYIVLDSKKEILNIEDKNKKYLIFDPDCDSSGMMSFTIDRGEDALSLADYLEIGIETLDNENGFFIMCEGARIDSALHANDARTAIGETEALSEAVGRALDFYEKHPEETLILVTGDHETGGISLGYTGTNYDTHFDSLFSQKISYLAFENDYVEKYKAENTPFDEILADIEELFGLSEMNSYEKGVLEKAWQKTLRGTESYTTEDWLSYANRTPFTTQVTRLAGNRAGVGFSTYVHTAAPMVLWAKGVGEESFSGTYDNTDVYNRLYGIFLK